MTDGSPASPPPSSRSGYSGTPLHRKLGVAAGSRVLVAGPADGVDLTRLDPEGTATVHSGVGDTAAYAVVVAFCPDLAALVESLERLPERVEGRGRLWLCWPKRSSGVVTDLTEGLVRSHGLATGLVDVKVCAVDQVWSGLCFVRRRPDRLH